MLSIRHFSIMLACGSALCSLAGQATVQELSNYYLEEANKSFAATQPRSCVDNRPLSELLLSKDEKDCKLVAESLFNINKDAHNKLDRKIKELDEQLEANPNDDWSIEYRKAVETFVNETKCILYSSFAHAVSHFRDPAPEELPSVEKLKRIFKVDDIIILDLFSLFKSPNAHVPDSYMQLASSMLQFLSEPGAFSPEAKRELHQKLIQLFWDFRIGKEDTSVNCLERFISSYLNILQGKPALDEPILKTPCFFSNLMAFMVAPLEKPSGWLYFTGASGELAHRANETSPSSTNESPTELSFEQLLQNWQKKRSQGGNIRPDEQFTANAITGDVTVTDWSDTCLVTDGRQLKERVLSFLELILHEFSHIHSKCLHGVGAYPYGPHQYLSGNAVRQLITFHEKNKGAVYEAVLSKPGPTFNASKNDSFASQIYNIIFGGNEKIPDLIDSLINEVFFGDLVEISNMWGFCILPGMPKSDGSLRKELLYFANNEMAQMSEHKADWRVSHWLTTDDTAFERIKNSIQINRAALDALNELREAVTKTTLKLFKNVI